MSDADSSPLQNCPKCGAPLAGGDPSLPCPACLMRLGLESWTGGQPESGSRIAATPTQAAASFDAPAPEEIAGFFPQLEILELLGQGGMGAVYKARQKNLDRLVALKIIRPDVQDQAGFDERFRREAKTLARLNHPHIVTVHDFGQAGDLYYLLMEYVDGVNLRQSLRKGHLAPAEALAIIPPLCDALQYAHEEGIVHRDIKPENILLDRKGRVKIADFGLAKLVGVTGESQGLTKSRQVMGTWHYMAPEQMQGTRDVDHRADIYSLGVVLYEMLTGELPIGRFAPPSQKVQVDVRLDRVVLRALESDPELRYQSAGDVRTDLSSVASSAPLGDAPTRTPSPDGGATSPSTLDPQRPREFTTAQRIAIGLGMLVGIVLVMIPPWHLTFPDSESQTYYSFLFSPPTGNFLTSNGVSWTSGHSIEWGLLLLELVLVGAVTTGVCWFLKPSESARTESKKPKDAMSAEEIADAPGMGLIVTGCMNWVLMAILFTLMAIAKARQGDPASSLSLRNDDLLFVAAILTVPLSGFVVLAGLKLRQLQSPGMVRFGSILAMLLTPGNLLGLPIGIWSLVTLTDKRVRTQMYGPDELNTPRCSRKAIWGAVWMGLFLLLPLVIVPTSVETYRTAEAPPPEMDSTPLAYVLLILAPAWTAIIGAPVLGLLAIADIRRQPRRLYGLPLAVVDAILLPLLILNGLLIWLVRSVMDELFTEAPPTSVTLLTAIIVCTVVTIWLTRWAWRAASAGLNGDEQPTVRREAPPPPAASPPKNPSAAVFAVAVPMVFSAIVVTVGLVLFVLSFRLREPGSQEFWGFMGGAFGCVVGGLGGVIGCWNGYRQIEGAPDLMSIPRWTWLDRSLLLYGLTGVILLIIGAGLYNAVRTETTGYSLMLGGGIAAFQGLGFSAYRTMIRRAARNVPTTPGTPE